MLSLTRQTLSDGSASDAFRSSAPKGTTLLTEEQFLESLDQTLHGVAPGADVHVFAYGSLMWNPAFQFSGESIATVRGWSRKFCLRLHMARGSPERPGIMLALDRGGACRGVAYRIAGHAVRNELLLLWRREMLAGVYHAKWVDAHSAGRSGAFMRGSSGTPAPIVCLCKQTMTMGRTSECTTRSGSTGRNSPRSMPRTTILEIRRRTGSITSRDQNSASPGKVRASAKTNLNIPPA